MEAATWSAVAASFAGLCSFMIFLVQRRTLLEAARPELVVLGWDRSETASKQDLLRFAGIRNVGKGAALNVVVNCFLLDESQSAMVTMATTMLPLVAPSETADLAGQVWLHWKAGHQKTHVAFDMVIHCWDARARRHTTRYKFFAVRGPAMIAGGVIAPGVSVTRTTQSRAVWTLKVQRRLSRIWGFRWLRPTD